MYLFAHLFSGVLIGLILFQIRRDWRVLPVCIAGALFSDLLDKPLSLLMPDVFGSTRTIGHALILSTILLVAAVILWQRKGNFLALVFAGMVLLHQVLDMLWTLPVTWFFPLHGMFEKIPAADGGLIRFFLIEVTNPPEWVFALVSCILIMTWYSVNRQDPAAHFVCIRASVQYSLAAILGITGFFLVITGVGLLSGSAPLHNGPDKILTAGIVALLGAIVLGLLPVQK